MYMVTELIYRTYCGIYLLSTSFKAFSLLISLSEVGTVQRIGKLCKNVRLHVLLDVYLLFIIIIFYLRFLKTFLK